MSAATCDCKTEQAEDHNFHNIGHADAIPLQTLANAGEFFIFQCKMPRILTVVAISKDAAGNKPPISACKRASLINRFPMLAVLTMIERGNSRRLHLEDDFEFLRAAF
ncbi:MAG: hypothetical protein WDM80_06085 [Limisphaerales bacterium]